MFDNSAMAWMVHQSSHSWVGCLQLLGPPPPITHLFPMYRDDKASDSLSLRIAQASLLLH